MTDNWMEKYRLEQAEKSKKGKAYLLGLLPILKKAGAAKLVVSYDGQGDSGEIQGIHVLDAIDTDLKILELDEEEIDTAACDVLSGQGIDWYNNEGGYGEVILTVKTKKITIENNQRVESSEYSHHEV